MITSPRSYELTGPQVGALDTALRFKSLLGTFNGGEARAHYNKFDRTRHRIMAQLPDRLPQPDETYDIKLGGRDSRNAGRALQFLVQNPEKIIDEEIKCFLALESFTDPEQSLQAIQSEGTRVETGVAQAVAEAQALNGTFTGGAHLLLDKLGIPSFHADSPNNVHHGLH